MEKHGLNRNGVNGMIEATVDMSKHRPKIVDEI
jgi:hypothetical protein